MNELLARLTNLGYELFSVLIPGFILLLFVVLWWGALGGLVPAWTCDVIPELTVATAREIANSLNAPTGAGVGLVTFAVCYFAGHILLWVARAGGPAKATSLKGFQRVFRCLILRIPKPENNYNPKLQTLYDQVQTKFAPAGGKLEWREFYPVVKVFLAENTKNSLIANYQNKYTFHRSIAAAAVLLLWCCVLSAIGAKVFAHSVPSLTYAWLFLLSVFAVSIVWGFSSSYLYHWEMFGNTVITEAYAYIFGPKRESKTEPKNEASK